MFKVFFSVIICIIFSYNTSIAQHSFLHFEPYRLPAVIDVFSTVNLRVDTFSERGNRIFKITKAKKFGLLINETDLLPQIEKKIQKIKEDIEKPNPKIEQVKILKHTNNSIFYSYKIAHTSLQLFTFYMYISSGNKTYEIKPLLGNNTLAEITTMYESAQTFSVSTK